MLLLSLLLSVAACRERILHDLDELQANKVLVLLAESGIHAEKLQQGNMWHIAVPQREATEALAMLEKSRILKPEQIRLSQRANTMMLSREERAQYLERQVAWSLEQTLERLPAVLEARVHLSLGPSDSLNPETVAQQQSASVLLISANEKQIDRAGIQQLIAGASGVKSSAVVVMVREAAIPGAESDSTPRSISHSAHSASVLPAAESSLKSKTPAAEKVGIPPQVTDSLQPFHWLLAALLSAALLFLVITIRSRCKHLLFRRKSNGAKGVEVKKHSGGLHLLRPQQRKENAPKRQNTTPTPPLSRQSIK